MFCELYFGAIFPAYNNNSRNERRFGFVGYLRPDRVEPGEFVNVWGWVKYIDAGEFDLEAYRRKYGRG